MWEERKIKKMCLSEEKESLLQSYCIFACFLFVANDAWVYQTPIVKITEVHTKESRKEEECSGRERTLL